MSQIKQSAATGPLQKIGKPAKRVLLAWEGARELVPELESCGFEIVTNPGEADFVVTYGGDGSLLRADHDYPQLPKLPIRRNSDYIKCDDHKNLEVFQRVRYGRQSVQVLQRLAASVKGDRFAGMNDIVFHNEHSWSAVRYRVWINGEPYGNEFVGDGLVVATPFGSSAYYRSITNSVFRVGIGLAFNNSTEAVTHLVLDSKAQIEVEVTRGPAIVMADNAVEVVRMEKGDRVSIGCSGESVEVWELSALTCRQCLVRETGWPAGHRHV